ncbi:homoserine kinase [Clostridium beijerinckii]|jgi:homoserine kinase|uniref:Homoserine kinase n=2 Tax=Clostridium beijerinckii TaxID=1520 RepID=KHSE_CLOB8|nr:homoserine kinase [Clostridium beijerinckii]A6LSZ4.1 RecName: Full=Homoserine kinase; Short=HK; Short=HSK [Clostridium beijerinckii NCIMB 8052]ABR33474.1 homoserine kinase [Clostridium beijerinckii NCIMB 8052]AIU00560.1 homoserine kinase [Clostridium beijerinckii ATCC 35702]MBF7811626.1 homoserine kinase [Clostridium beijerinckii]NRT25266.1 homoserine kinase [Clostridium beijerinckii]NRT67140.1 homoserine kinase [Clostridium beijerinckii]
MITVRVPATSANMGPGFDTLGIALNLYNDFGFREIEDGLKFNGMPEEFCNEDNIIYKAMKYCFDKAGYKIKGLEISEIKQDVPVSRGLGSSSTCIVGGLVGANEILGKKFSEEELLEMAVEIEGHPDNVAPALLGGMVVAIFDENKTYYDKIDVKNGIKFISIIPNFRLSTEEARKVLPKEISLKDGVYNVSRAALMVACFSSGKYELLRYACKDAFHQNYRSKLIPGFEEVYNKSYELGALACYLSGAGPTIMAIIDEKDERFSNKLKEFLQIKGLEWNILGLSLDNAGATIIEGTK